MRATRTAPLMTLLLLACNDKAEDSGVPDLNYIPDYSNTCSPEGDEIYDAAGLLEDLVAAQSFWVAEHFELCSDAMEGSCAPCTADENPFLKLLREQDQWLSAEAQASIASGALAADDLEQTFQGALQYPWRHLLLSPSTDGAQITLAHGVTDTCLGGCEQEFVLSIESLDATCQAFEHVISSEISESTADEIATTSLAAGPHADAFGFAAPVVDELPAVESFASVGALQEWMSQYPLFTTEVSGLEISGDLADGAGCARMTGSVSTSLFADYAASDDALSDYATAGTDQIPIVLSVQLRDATVRAPVVY